MKKERAAASVPGSRPKIKRELENGSEKGKKIKEEKEKKLKEEMRDGPAEE